MKQRLEANGRTRSGGKSHGSLGWFPFLRWDSHPFVFGFGHPHLPTNKTFAFVGLFELLGSFEPTNLLRVASVLQTNREIQAGTDVKPHVCCTDLLGHSFNFT